MIEALRERILGRVANADVVTDWSHTAMEVMKAAKEGCFTIQRR